MKAFVISVCALLLAGLLVTASAHAQADDDDCEAVMAALVAAQRDAQAQMDVNDALEAAISAPTWDPVADDWMLQAYATGVTDLLGYLNTAAIAADRAHAAHCY